MRANHVDVARALCIVLVVFGHSDLASQYQDANTILTSFRMPLFFILAGAFFAPRQTLSDTLWRKSDGLLKPYLAMAALYAPIYLIRNADATWLNYGLGVLSFSGKEIPGRLQPLWFLTLLWALHVGGRIFVQWTGFDQAERPRQICWIVLLLMGGYTLMNLFNMLPLDPADSTWPHRGLPFNLQLWPLTAAFFLTGYLLSQAIRTWSPGGSTTIVAALVFGATHLLYDPSINLLEPLYSDLIVTTVAALSGSLALIGLSYEISRIPSALRVLAPVGRMSLYILLFHSLVLSVANKISGQFVHTPILETVADWGILVFSVAICAALGKAIQRMPTGRLLFEPLHKWRPLTPSNGRPVESQVRGEARAVAPETNKPARLSP